MAVSRLKGNSSKNDNISNILYNLAKIWNDKKYVIRGWAQKPIGFGLKQSEFSDFEEKSNSTKERKFREYKHELLESKLIHEVYTKNKKSGRPYYQITPIGIAYLVQNSELETKDIRDCFDILIYYNKNKIDFKWKNEYEYSFKKSCELVSGNAYITTFDSIIGDDLKSDLTIGVHTIFHGKENMADYRNASQYIIGNMCWFLLQFDTVQKNVGDWAKKSGNKEFQSVRVSKELIKVGVDYGKNILKNILQKETSRVKEIISEIKY